MAFDGILNILYAPYKFQRALKNKLIDRKKLLEQSNKKMNNFVRALG